MIVQAHMGLHIHIDICIYTRIEIYINSSAYVKPHLILFVNASVLYGQVEVFTKNSLSYELSIGAKATDITPPRAVDFFFTTIHIFKWVNIFKKWVYFCAYQQIYMHVFIYISEYLWRAKLFIFFLIIIHFSIIIYLSQ